MVSSVGAGVTAPVQDTLDGILAATEADQARRAQRRVEPALVRLWDGDWDLRGRVSGEIKAEFRWVLNNTGTGTITLPADHYLAKWAADTNSRGTKNVHITVDKDGARWGGRMSGVSIRKKDNGEREVEIRFLDFMEDLKHIRVWANPVLPAAIQFPRAFTLAGPSIWALKLALFLNLMRNQNSLFTLPDNPLDFSQWTGNLNMANWPVSMRGQSLLGDSSPHCVVSSRFKTWHDLAAPILADAQLCVTYEIYLPGDPQPWPGYTPRVGQVIYDIVDKSGWWGSTGTGGNILHGIARTAMQLLDNGVDMDRTVVSDPNSPDFRGNDWLGTAPGAPWVVLREGELTGIQSSEFTYQPATDVQVVVGGHSAPGVNEIISSAIQLAGDLASSTFIGPNVNLGQVADTLLQPLYTDTLLAWMAFKSTRRAQELGWSHYFEYMPGNADRAYTLSSLMAIRRGWWETRERVGHHVKIADGAPYTIGANGRGHFFIGDRIATTHPLVADKLVVEQVTELDLSWDRTSFGWDVTVGSLARTESGLDQVVRQVSQGVSALQELGVL